mmetsp:Transcript_150381/g.262779  ORF Transcript_150381/g.262779 Transcript_150381/m.262779 type:complete len:97 (+) Transcript_150381:272-562(+)
METSSAPCWFFSISGQTVLLADETAQICVLMHNYPSATLWHGCQDSHTASRPAGVTGLGALHEQITVSSVLGPPHLILCNACTTILAASVSSGFAA